jgi:hypothetical protein
MKLRSLVLAALALAPAAAFAHTPARIAVPAALQARSAFALPAVDLVEGPAVLAVRPAGSVLEGFIAGSATTLESIRYRPRRSHAASRYWMPVASQLHAGFYNPSGDPSSGFLFGFRGGPMVDPHVQIGLMVDWSHKSDRVAEVIGSGTIPGVGDVTITDERLRGRTDFVPMLGFIQVGGDDRMPVSPYGGIGGGYEVLAVQADLADGTRFDATYGGWGWQAWAGAAVPLSGQSRLFGEAFYNQTEMGRDVDYFGRTLRETVDFNGVGLRFGLNWGF